MVRHGANGQAQVGPCGKTATPRRLPAILRAHPRASALLCGLAISALLLAVVEGVLFVLNPCKRKPAGPYPRERIVEDPVLGYKPMPSVRSRVLRTATWCTT